MSIEIKLNHVLIEFPILVETPDGSIALYFSERAAFFAAPAQEHRKEKPFFAADATSVYKCRPLGKGSSITLINQ